MAGRFQYLTSFVDPTAVTATSAATGFAATRAANRLQPYRQWRSTGTGVEQDLVFDAGSAKTLTAVGLLMINVPQIKLQVSDDNVSYSALPGHTLEELYLPALDRRDGIYKFFVSFTSTTKRYLRVRMPASQTPVDGATYYEIGTLFWATAPTLLLANPDNPMPVTFDPNEDQQTLAGRREIVAAGAPFLRMTFRVKVATAAERAQWDDLKLLGQRTPVLWFFNEDQVQDLYWMQYDGDITTEEDWGHNRITQIWRQLI